MYMDNMENNPTPSKKKGKRKWIIVGVVIIVVVLIGVIIIMPGNNNSSSTSSPSPTSQSITVVSSGTVVTLPAGSCESYQFSAASSGSIYGNFTATNGVTTYVFTPSEYANFTSSGSASSYQYTTGNVNSGTINTNLAPNTYYVVFENTNAFTTTSLDFTSDVTFTWIVY
jgi:hypothetical protein